MSIVKTYTNRLLCSLFLIILVSSCSAQDTSPTDQLIKGPFNVTTEWQVFQLDKPLETAPHSIKLEALFSVDQYKFVDTDEPNTPYSIMSDRLMRLSDSKITQPEVILVDSKGREFRPLFRSIATAYTDLGDFKALGFGTNTDMGKFYYPKDVVFTAVKLKSNIAMSINYLRWVAYHYYQAPNHTWSDVLPSEIVTLQ